MGKHIPKLLYLTMTRWLLEYYRVNDFNFLLEREYDIKYGIGATWNYEKEKTIKRERSNVNYEERKDQMQSCSEWYYNQTNNLYIQARRTATDSKWKWSGWIRDIQSKNRISSSANKSVSKHKIVTRNLLRTREWVPVYIPTENIAW